MSARSAFAIGVEVRPGSAALRPALKVPPSGLAQAGVDGDERGLEPLGEPEVSGVVGRDPVALRELERGAA